MQMYGTNYLEDYFTEELAKFAAVNTLYASEINELIEVVRELGCINSGERQ